MMRTVKEARTTGRWWSPAASLIVTVFFVLGAMLLVAGHDPGGLACLGLAAAYVPIRLARRYVAAAAETWRRD